MAKNEKPLSETLTDAEIARRLKEQGQDDTAQNIDLFRKSREITEGYIKQLRKGKPIERIIAEIQINSLRKN